MVFFEELTSDFFKIDAKGKRPMAPMAAPWPNQTGSGSSSGSGSGSSSNSMFFHGQNSLSLTFLRDRQGVVLKLSDPAPEMTKNFMTCLPTSSQHKSYLETPQGSTSLPKDKGSTSLPRRKVKMLGWKRNSNKKAIDCASIMNDLRGMIKDAVHVFRVETSSPFNLNEIGSVDDVLEVIPVSFRPPQPTNMDRPRKRVTTILVGETLTSFDPRDRLFTLEDIEKLMEEHREAIPPNANGETIYNLPRYTFLQRLEGWKLQRRQRVNGRLDMYYRHLKSRRVFRSITEVVKFFLFEVFPDKTKLGEDGLPRKKRKKREKNTARPYKRPYKRRKKKVDEKKKPREKWQPIYDLNLDIQKEYGHHNPMYDQNVEDQKAPPVHNHIPFFDLNDEHQKEEDDHHDHHENPIYINLDDDDDDDQKGYDDNQNNSPMYDDDDDVGDNYEEEYDHKKAVEKFLAESYDNLMNLPHHADQKSTPFSFDINEEISEEVEEDVNFNPNDQTVEELLSEAYDSLMKCSKNEPKSPKGKESRSRSIEKPRRKKVKTLTPPTSFLSFPNTPIINSIPSENSNNNNKEKGKEKMTAETVVESKEEVLSSTANVKHKRFIINEENGNLIFSEVDCEETTTTTEGDGGQSSNAMEVAQTVACLHMYECDLINHIPQSLDLGILNPKKYQGRFVSFMC